MDLKRTTRTRRKCNVPECFVEIIKAKYPTTNTEALAKELGVKAKQLQNWAYALRVRKDKDFVSRQCSISSQRSVSRFECERIGRAAE